VKLLTTLLTVDRSELSQITCSARLSSATYFGFGEKLSTVAIIN